MALDYPFAAPGDTLTTVRNLPPNACQNPGLLFERFAAEPSADSRARRAGLEAVQACGVDEKLLAALRDRYNSAYRAFQATVLRAVATTRVIVGLGKKGTYEVGFSFHRIYGVPVIPGSGLKGLARSYATLVEGLDEGDELFRLVFGVSPDDQSENIETAGESPASDIGRRGAVVFWDGLPERRFSLDLDIMNPHYPQYYQDPDGRTPPANWQSPVPVYFLTIPAGAVFRMAISPAKPDPRLQEAVNAAERWLTGGLQELGVGAKTSSGYGYFTVTRESLKS